jgi:hypothetical protein
MRGVGIQILDTAPDLEEVEKLGGEPLRGYPAGKGAIVERAVVGEPFCGVAAREAVPQVDFEYRRWLQAEALSISAGIVDFVEKVKQPLCLKA